MKLINLLVENEIINLEKHTLALQTYDFINTPELSSIVSATKELFDGFKSLRSMSKTLGVTKIPSDQINQVELLRKKIEKVTPMVNNKAREYTNKLRALRDEFNKTKTHTDDYNKMYDLLTTTNSLVSDFLSHADIKSKIK